MSEHESESESLQNLPSERDGSWLGFARRFGRRRATSIDATGERPSASGPTSPLLSAIFTGLPNDYGTLPRIRASQLLRQYSVDPESPVAGPAEIGVGNLSRVSSISFFHSFRRPKSTYDRVLEESLGVYDDTNNYINGIRFYYSTFTSIDWLHDAIKDSTRVLRLRRRKSLRGRVVNALDRSLGVHLLYFSSGRLS
jgi:chloride channel 3/4/5